MPSPNTVPPWFISDVTVSGAGASSRPSVRVAPLITLGHAFPHEKGQGGLIDRGQRDARVALERDRTAPARGPGPRRHDDPDDDWRSRLPGGREGVAGRLVARMADEDLVEGEQPLAVIEDGFDHDPFLEIQPIAGGARDQGPGLVGRVPDQHAFITASGRDCSR